MRRVLACILGVGLSANGLMRLMGHALWYASVAALAETRPFNDYPVRDVGVAYVVAGVALVRLALRHTGRSAAQAGETFLALHAAVRRWDHAARQEQANQLLADVTTLFLPPLLALWIPVTIALRHSVNEGEER